MAMVELARIDEPSVLGRIPDAETELAHLRSQRNDLQASNTALVAANRELKARIAGRPVVPTVRFGARDLPLPGYAKTDDSGMDVRADLTYFERSTTELDAEGRPLLSRGAAWFDGRVQLDHGARLTIGIGFGFGTPTGYEWQVRPRSGGSKRGVDITFGTIDAGFTGEIAMTVVNWTGWPQTISHGDRLAQVVLVPIIRADPYEVDALKPTERGENGLGSTGVR